MSLSAALAQFVAGLRQDAIPGPILEKARTCLLNSYGIAMGSLATPYAPVARQAALAIYGSDPGGATLLGDGRKTRAAGAALANAALFHGRAQEDTCGAAHFGTILVPLLTAMIEADGYAESGLLCALVAGYEVGGLLEQAFAGSTTPAGFRSSPLYGTIAAAAAAASLMKLSPQQTEGALANAASLSGGILQSFADGSDEWRYQVGVAAQTGLAAAQLAKAGSVSARHAFEGRAGLIRSFARQECDASTLAQLAGKLGREWSISRVTFKPYPVCAFNQTPVTAALQVRARLGDAGTRGISRVQVRMNPYETGYAGMDARGPFHSISGTLMSIPFCIASTLIHGAPSMAAMLDFDDAVVRELIPRIALVPDETVSRLCCTIELDFADGQQWRHEQVMSTDDFAYDRATARELVLRVGAESGIPAAIYTRLERFIDDPSGCGMDTVTDCFAAAARHLQATQKDFVQ